MYVCTYEARDVGGVGLAPVQHRVTCTVSNNKVERAFYEGSWSALCLGMGMSVPVYVCVSLCLGTCTCICALCGHHTRIFL